MANVNPVAVGGLVGTGAGAAIGGPLGAQIGGGLGSLAGSMFGGDGVSQEALSLLKQAQARIMAIPSPTAQDLKLVLQPLVQKGVLTPEQFQTIAAKPTSFLNINLDPTSREAEMKALGQLQNISDAGGNDAQFREAMTEARNTAGTQLRGERDSILQNAAERGATNSNLTAAQQLAQASEDANGLNSQTTQAASSAEQRALQALMNSATLGANVHGQDYQEQTDRAKAIDAINAYNAQNTQAQSNLNTGTANSAQQYNLELGQNLAQYNNQLTNEQNKYNAALPQQVFQNKLQQAGAAAGIALPTANLLQQGFQNTNAQQGNIVGNIGTSIGNYSNNKNAANVARASTTAPASGTQQSGFGQPASSYAQSANPNDPFRGNPYGVPQYAEGGRVPGHARVPGDNPTNDTVPARLSPGEVVVPRTAANDPARLAEFVKHVSKPAPEVHADDVRHVLEALSKIRTGYAYGGRAC